MSSFATHFLQKVLLVGEITFTMNRFTCIAKTIYFREMFFFFFFFFFFFLSDARTQYTAGSRIISFCQSVKKF